MYLKGAWGRLGWRRPPRRRRWRDMKTFLWSAPSTPRRGRAEPRAGPTHRQADRGRAAPRRATAVRRHRTINEVLIV